MSMDRRAELYVISEGVCPAVTDESGELPSTDTADTLMLSAVLSAMYSLTCPWSFA